MNKLHLLPALALAAGFSGTALAHGDGHAATAAEPASQQSSPGAEAMTVVRDADTGKLRAPTPAEFAELMRSRQASARNSVSVQRRTSSPAVLVRRHAGGAVSVRMTNEMLSYSVVKRQADGSLVEICVDNADEAHAAVHQHATTSRAAAPRSPALETE